MTEKEPYYGDLEKTTILNELFKVEGELRDENWREKFFENVADASFACSDPQIISGPDGFPYFVLNTPEPNKQFQCYVIKNMIPDFLLEQGFGVVINPEKGNPDWVFSYGDIVNYHLKNEFYTKSDNWDMQKSDEVIAKEEKVLVGQPSEYIIPVQTRAILRMFFESLQITDAKIALLNRPKGEEFSQQLVFNLTPDKFKDREHFNTVMAYVSWFLPKHYSYASMEESSLGENFILV
ncbi:hypothetical protein CLV62_11451 [Dysgonomonas alginatilytica]|uniref:Uncharacterized protein n=1 Tax=Dysgonomonas alginatilytica TaxID=1605892 RepID=A0A2V3PQA7_9BACT|nr:hypothetical protein [Dysgonomonas alginatilytica]PXV63334.1 hypothetical protein CLV62_11451 [Dysgonomonas alginatilytica]